MKNILVPTDFSENAGNAIDFALQLHKNEACVFYILNTYIPEIIQSRFMASSTVFVNGVESESKARLQQTLRTIKKKYPEEHYQFKAISSFEILANKMVEIVESKNIDLVVSGTKGLSGMKHVFMGSNTVKMIKSIKSCPLLAVPQNCSYANPTHIALATDLKRSFSAIALNSLLSIVKRFNATIHVVHIRTKKDLDKIQQANLKILQDYLTNVKNKVHFLPAYDQKTDIINNFLNENMANMLALIHNEQGYLESLMHEPVVKNMVGPSSFPILVLPS